MWETNNTGKVISSMGKILGSKDNLGMINGGFTLYSSIDSRVT